MVSWQFLLLGTFGAVGFAMAMGTLAALANYKRNGHFPNAAPGAPPPERKHFVGMWLRVVIGLVLAVAGLASLVVNDLI